MTFRDDLTALAARHAALEAEVAAKTAELAAATDLLEQARARTRLPVLDNIRIASPCSADWTQMTGDDRVRACASCKQRVYNLSEMTRDEAEQLISSHEGRLCVRYFQRSDGTILTADCRVGVKRRRRRKLVAASAATLLAGGAGAYVVRQHHQDEAPEVFIGQFPPPPDLVERTTANETAPPPPHRPLHFDPPRHRHRDAQVEVQMGQVMVPMIQMRDE
jgi:hypothetical protein